MRWLDGITDWMDPDPSSKATLWLKAQHEGALPPPCIVRKDPRAQLEKNQVVPTSWQDEALAREGV